MYDSMDALSGEDYAALMEMIEEEAFADAYAGINAFGAHAERWTEATHQKMDELYVGKARNQENGVRQTNGPPNERYSVVDENEISGYSNNRNDLGLRGDSQKMPKSGREWSAFNRRFANKTSDMSIGEERDIVVFTDTYAYFVTADGYMQGYVNEKIRISEKNRDRINRVEEYINGSHKERRTFDRWVDDVQREERRDNGNYAAFGYSRKTGFDVGVYEEQQGSIRTGIDEESATDNALITSEEYVPADLLSAQATIDELQKIVDEVEQMVTNSEELET